APVIELRPLGDGGCRDRKCRRGAGKRRGIFQELSTGLPWCRTCHRLSSRVTRERDADIVGARQVGAARKLRCGRLCSARWARSRPPTPGRREAKSPDVTVVKGGE